MSSDLYLVAHKCRGQATFDIAVRLDCGTPTDPGPWWIHATGGWRLYPYLFYKIDDCHFVRGTGALSRMPPDARDCFGSDFDRCPARIEPSPRARKTVADLEALL